VSDFQPGEIVDLTIKGVCIARPRSATSVTIVDEHGITYQMPPQASVERIAPAEWPPQPGDLWRDRDGSVWLACRVGNGDVSIITMICADGVADRAHEQVLARLGPLTLVYREERAEDDAKYPEPGSGIPDQPGYVVGKCGHRVAASEWRAGFRVCERCPYPVEGGEQS